MAIVLLGRQIGGIIARSVRWDLGAIQILTYPLAPVTRGRYFAIDALRDLFGIERDTFLLIEARRALSK